MRNSFTSKEPLYRRLLSAGAWFSVALSAFLLAADASGVSAAADFSENSVIVITIKDASGLPAATASGTVLRGDGLVATTCSVITQWLLGTRHTMRIVTSDGTDMPVIDVLSCDRKTNTALILIPAEGLRSVMALKQKDAPKSAVLLSRLSRQEVRRTPLSLIPPNKKSLAITSSTPVSESLAGGPVLNERGAALGIATLDRTSRTTMIVPIETLFDMYGQYRKLQKKRSQIELLERMGEGVYSEERSLPAEVIQAKRQVGAQPENPEAHLSLGKACYAAMLFGCAIDAYRTVVRLDPDRLEGHVNLGLASYRAGRYRDAANAYEGALRVQPQSASILIIKLGAAYLILGDYAQAVSILKNAANLEPKNPQARYNLGIAYFLNGDKNAAMTEYLHLNAIDPERARSLFDLLN